MASGNGLEKCQRCGWDWHPKVAEPVECPKCRNRGWRTASPLVSAKLAAALDQRLSSTVVCVNDADAKIAVYHPNGCVDRVFCDNAEYLLTRVLHLPIQIIRIPTEDYLASYGVNGYPVTVETLLEERAEAERKLLHSA